MSLQSTVSQSPISCIHPFQAVICARFSSPQFRLNPRLLRRARALSLYSAATEETRSNSIIPQYFKQSWTTKATG